MDLPTASPSRNAGFGILTEQLRLGRLAELGVRRVYLQVLDLHDLDHLELVAREVAPQLS